jgi:hypothetical protein
LRNNTYQLCDENGEDAHKGRDFGEDMLEPFYGKAFEQRMLRYSQNITQLSLYNYSQYMLTPHTGVASRSGESASEGLHQLPLPPTQSPQPHLTTQSALDETEEGLESEETTQSKLKDPKDPATSPLEDETRSRAESFLTRFVESKRHPNLTEVIRDRIWPFYSGWIHGPLGPCTRTAEFERNDDGDITSVTIYLTSTRLPSDSVQEIIERYTLSLVPEAFRSEKQVIVEFGEGNSTSAATLLQECQVNDEVTDLKMGDGIKSCFIKKDGENRYISTGSSGPWFRTSNGTVFLYTNEHVVRLGIENGTKTIAAHPHNTLLGDVVLTSGDGWSIKDDATMESNNPEAPATSSFLADWAIIRLWNPLLNFFIEMPNEYGKIRRSCNHANDITHVPTAGTAAGAGAASRKPWIAAYGCRIQSDGLPTVFSPGRWGKNTKELSCWSLSRLKEAPYTNEQWLCHGLGVEGDSGAGVVDCKTQHVCALVIGSTEHKTGSGIKHRTTHIIDMKDVKKDTEKAIQFAIQSGRATSAGLPADFGSAEIVRCNCEGVERIH